jgi:pseudomonalisin
MRIATTVPTRRAVLAALALALGLAPVAPAAPPPAVNDNDVVRLPGNVNPNAKPEFDVGGSDTSLPMEHLILALRPQPGAQAALERLLADQQDPASPDHHRWLTPEEFGTRFGPTTADLAVLTSWLTAHGFVVDEVARGRLWVNVTGTVADVERAFHTQIHDYLVGGELHHANASDPEIPRALAAFVAGPVSLNDFRRQSMSRVIGAFAPNPVGPEFTSGSSHYLAPADFATVYDVSPLYTAGIDGTGQAIAIVGRTDIALGDVQYFRTLFGLPANDPQFVHNGTDPGDLGGGEETEGDLDVEWSGAVAPHATIKFVISQSTMTTDGVDLSAQYIVDNATAPVMSTSFGLCESSLGSAENTFYSDLWAQAAAEGITSLVSSGDSGAAGCDSPSSNSGTVQAVSGLSSTPSNVCVGGTQFMDTSNPAAYWSATNDPTTQGSALSYIPEQAWNESGSVAGGSGLWASGGGVSSIYAKPSWQVAPGVPDDNARDVPDVALTAAGHDGYLVVQGHTSRRQGLIVVGGTSASSPSFAGIMALIVQKTGSSQGNANVRLYQLGNVQYTGGAAVFHDTVTGDNTVPGVTGFACGTGYDLATGLGSVDANALADAWTTPCTAPGSFALVSPTNGQSLASATQATLQWGASAGATSYDVYLGTSASPPLLQSGVTGTSLVAAVSAGQTYFWKVVARVSCNVADTATAGPWSFSVQSAGPVGAGFYPVAPCRVVDTRNLTDPAAVKRGTFADNETRAYTLSQSTDCPGLPTDAAAWSLNIQFRPSTQAAFLTAFPDGVSRPAVSTLVGFPPRWRVNNAIVSAGSAGTFDVYCQFAGNVVIDVNGYFK